MATYLLPSESSATKQISYIMEIMQSLRIENTHHRDSTHYRGYTGPPQGHVAGIKGVVGPVLSLCRIQNISV